jgi:hypothetical protein
MATDEKCTMPAAYSNFDQPAKPAILKPRTQKVLLVYATAVTTAFVVATILGAVYYSSTLTQLQAQNNILLQDLTQITVNATTQKVAVDTTNQVSIFYPQGPGVANGTVAAIDYKRGITGIYDPNTRECYVTAGIPSGAPGAIALQTEVNSGQYPSGTTSKTYYQMVDNIAVQDHSVLPSPLQPICAGLSVYWMQQATAPATTTNTTSISGRKKRDLAYACYSGTMLYYPSYFCCRAEVCIYIGNGYWYCYLYCSFCRTYGGVGSLVYYSYSC